MSTEISTSVISSSIRMPAHILFFFFFNDPATTEIYPLSLHDAFPISHPQRRRHLRGAGGRAHVAVRRRPPHDARAAVEFLLRPGHDEAQGVLRPSPGTPMTEYREIGRAHV